MATEVVHLIKTGETYTTLASWEAGEQRNLVTADEIAVAEVESGTTNTVNYLDFNGWTCDSTRYCLIRAKSGDEFIPDTLTGAKLSVLGSYGYVLRAGHTVHTEDVGITGSSNLHFIYIADNTDSANYFERCTIYGNTNLRMLQTSGADSNYYYNCYIKLSGSGSYCAVRNSYVYNCSITAADGDGEFSGDMLIRDSECKNTVAYNQHQKITYDTFYNCTGDYNAQNDNDSASPPGANSISTVTTGTFESYAGGDLHLASDSTVLNGAGTNLYTTYTQDIDRDTWPSSGDFDIGFDYYVAAGTTITTTPPNSLLAAVNASINAQTLISTVPPNTSWASVGAVIELPSGVTTIVTTPPNTNWAGVTASINAKLSIATTPQNTTWASVNSDINAQTVISTTAPNTNWASVATVIEATTVIVTTPAASAWTGVSASIITVVELGRKMIFDLEQKNLILSFNGVELDENELGIRLE